MWWMESSSPSVQYQHFQLCQLPSNHVEKGATRNRKNCGKAEADVELGFADCGELFCSAEFECIKSLGILRASSQEGSTLIESAGKLAAGGSNLKDAALSSPVWLTDAITSERAMRLAPVDTNQDQSFPERARKLAAENFAINDEDDSKVAAQSPHISC